ncbi:hypothetical protein [Faecalibaculum rodentium]|uniref:hypothetical protein n=1 Tax=Faecalibaculum rodentium TaxID=1702221 RepID=UPI0025AF3571|nr:hypothetical protein [Faecalibaculum rodentium]
MKPYKGITGLSRAFYGYFWSIQPERSPAIAKKDSPSSGPPDGGGSSRNGWPRQEGRCYACVLRPFSGAFMPLPAMLLNPLVEQLGHCGAALDRKGLYQGLVLLADAQGNGSGFSAPPRTPGGFQVFWFYAGNMDLDVVLFLFSFQSSGVKAAEYIMLLF